MRQAAGQISLFAELDALAEDPLRRAVEVQVHEGAHLRIFAALTFPYFQQYAERWMCREYTGGVYASIGAGRARITYTADGARYDGPGGAPIRFSWRQMTAKAREMIEEESWLTHVEEREVGRLVAEYGQLPYPCAAASYPYHAWRGAKPWFRGICKRCGTLDRNGLGACCACGGKVMRLTPEEERSVNGIDGNAEDQNLLHQWQHGGVPC